MTHPTLLAALAVWSACSGILAGEARSNLLDRIALIESRNNDLAVGDNGRSLGRYQMSLAAWLDVSALRAEQGLPLYPWEAAHDAGIGREYALQYLGILSRQFQAAFRGRYPSDNHLIGMYQHGFKGWKRSLLFQKGKRK